MRGLSRLGQAKCSVWPDLHSYFNKSPQNEIYFSIETPVIFSVYWLQENEAFLAVPRAVMMTTTSAKSSALGRNRKIVNIF